MMAAIETGPTDKVRLVRTGRTAPAAGQDKAQLRASRPVLQTMLWNQQNSGDDAGKQVAGILGIGFQPPTIGNNCVKRD
jgi:hypothetical protein